MADDRTSHLSLPLPSPYNDLDEDVGRIRQALAGIDAAVADLEGEREETHALTADQVLVDLSTLPGLTGATVFVDGRRLPSGRWSVDPDIPTRLVLASAYPAGSEVTVVLRRAG